VSFEAALDASNGRLWLKEPLGECQPANYTTQRRRVERAGRVLGLAARVGESEAEQLCELLGIDGVVHDQARRMYIASHGLRQRGEAVRSVLRQLRVDDDLWVRFLGAGFVAGVWATPWFWQPELNRRFSPLSRVVRASQHPP
jgi:hypothetical protein